MSTIGSDEVVQLNVGGKLFATHRSTLMAYPDTMLARMFSSSAELAKKGPNGEYFLDRNPDLFAIILEFYRKKELIVPKATPLQSLYSELAYFGIDFDEDDIQIADEPKHVPVECYLSLMNAYKNIPEKGHLLGNVIMGLPLDRYSEGEETSKSETQKQYEAIGNEPQKDSDMAFSKRDMDLEADSYDTTTLDENSPSKKKYKQDLDEEQENGPYEKSFYPTLKAINGLLTDLSADSAFCVGGVLEIFDHANLTMKPPKQEGPDADFKDGKPVCAYKNWCHINTAEHKKEYYHPKANKPPPPPEEAVNCGTIRDLNIDLIKNMCTSAPFGDLKTMTTKIDPNVRLALECNSDRFKVNFNLTDVANFICSKLNSNRPIKLVPYKINIYEPGGFFKEHVDTPINPGDMIGSLVVCVPSEHEGGELVVSHNGVSQTFDFAPKSGIKKIAQWAAFYSDCIHEVKRVTKGTRMTITYLIEVDKSFASWHTHPPEIDPSVVKNFYCGPSDADKNTTRINNLVALLNELPTSIVKIGLFLSHKYTSTAMHMETLKGSDKILINKVGAKWHYYLTPVIYNEYSKKYVGDYDSSENDCKSGLVYAFSMEDLKYLCGKGPKPQHKLTKVPFVMSTQKGNLLYHNEDEGAEHTGNESRPAESDSVYFHATVILVRK